MEDPKEQTAFSRFQTFAPRQNRRKWLLLGGSIFLLILTLGIAFGANQAQAAGGAAPGDMIAQHMSPTMMPTGMPGQCDGQLTVTGVTDKTITVTGPNGNTMTVYVTSRTQYVKSGQVVTASAVKVGSQIYVIGSCVQGHIIRASRIEISG